MGFARSGRPRAGPWNPPIDLTPQPLSSRRACDSGRPRSFALTVYVLAWAQTSRCHLRAVARTPVDPSRPSSRARSVRRSRLPCLGGATGRPISTGRDLKKRAQLSTVTADRSVASSASRSWSCTRTPFALRGLHGRERRRPTVYELTRAALWAPNSTQLVGSAPRTNRHSMSGRQMRRWPRRRPLILSDSDRFVALGQFVSVFALSTAVAGIGARVGLQRPATRRSAHSSCRSSRSCWCSHGRVTRISSLRRSSLPGRTSRSARGRPSWFRSVSPPDSRWERSTSV